MKNPPAERSVVITKNGRACAVLFPVTKDTDLESMLLAQRKDFWRLVDRAHKEGKKKGFTKLEDLPDRQKKIVVDQKSPAPFLCPDFVGQDRQPKRQH